MDGVAMGGVESGLLPPDPAADQGDDIARAVDILMGGVPPRARRYSAAAAMPNSAACSARSLSTSRPAGSSTSA